MKMLLAFLTLLTGLRAISQKPVPAGVANTYTLGDADGFPGFNYMNIMYSPTGKVYAQDYSGALHINGNNFMRSVSFPQNVQARGIEYLSEEKDTVHVFYYPLNVDIVGNKIKRIDTYKNLKTASEYIRNNNSYYRFEMEGNKITTYKWEQNKLMEKGYSLIADTLENRKIEILRNNNYLLLTVFTDPRIRNAYLLDTNTYQFIFKKTIQLPYSVSSFLYDENFNINKGLLQSFTQYFKTMTGNGPSYTSFYDPPNKGHFVFDSRKGLYNGDGHFIFTNGNNYYEYGEYDSSGIISNSVFPIYTKERLTFIYTNPSYPYCTAITGNKPIRIFPYIKKYPHLFNNDHSENIFSVVQDTVGNIWAGSYQNYISVISPTGKITQLKEKDYSIMNGGLSYGNYVYLIGESNGGLLKIDNKLNVKQIQPNTSTGFYIFVSKKYPKLYVGGTAEYGIWQCDVSELSKPTIHWNKLNKQKGVMPMNILTITEDTLGRIWFAHPGTGFGIYYPEKDTAVGFDMENAKIHIGAKSSLTDYKGTVWLGGKNGLWYYNDYNKKPLPQNIQHLPSPLLDNAKTISAMCMYKHWLVLACNDKICLLNLDSFYQNKSIIVRYLNPQEAAFTSFTEQNTLLVSKTDSTVWFSTSDMLYQLDIKKWLQNPAYKVNVQSFIQHDISSVLLNPCKETRLKEGINNLEIYFEYLSPDCLPRYTRTAMAMQDEAIDFSSPNLQSRFEYRNLKTGSYKFYLEVFEQDGSIGKYCYAFKVRGFFYQQWWFWVVLSLLFAVPLFLWLNTRRLKALQQEKISNLNIVTLSAQFRPHFIINALNTIGADLHDYPSAESVIGRLTESINLIFNHAQQKQITHSLKSEWVLVKNVIEIHRLMYFESLQVEYPDTLFLQQFGMHQVPMGILEVFVENALLHGLRNKETPPYILKIEITLGRDHLVFSIRDNGIGRENAKLLSSYRSNGTGTKNISGIIEILNTKSARKFSFSYIDLGNNGTKAIITIPR